MTPDSNLHTSSSPPPLSRPAEAERVSAGGRKASFWLLRWDTQEQPRPSVRLPEESRTDFGAHMHVYPGGFALFEGYLFDQSDLIPGPCASPAACIAQAYQLYGEAFIDRLRGGYALAVWDRKRDCLLAGRDAMGLHPCYYYWDGRLLVLSPDLDLILAQPEVSSDPNRVFLTEYLMSVWHAHQRQETVYAQVQRLPAAHLLHLSARRLQIERYWDPLPPGFAWATEEELESMPEVLSRGVQRCLSVGADSLALSGGYDSVSLAVIAREQLQGCTPLQAISLRFSLGAVDEGETQVAVARALGMPQILRDLRQELKETPFVAASLSLSRASPSPVLSVWQSMYTGLLQSAAARGLTKMIMGTGGDEMFTVDTTYGADRLAALDLSGLWRFYRAMARSSPFPAARVARLVFWNYAAKPEAARLVRTLLDGVVPRLSHDLRRRHLALPAWISKRDPRLRQALMRRRLYPYGGEQPARGGAYVQTMRNLPQAPLLMSELEQGFSWAKRAGFTLLFPFYDRDLVGLALRMHPEHLLSLGRAKSPLRRLVAERLPEVQLPARKVDFSRPGYELLRRHGLEAWRSLKRPFLLETFDIIDRQYLDPLIEGFLAGRNDNYLLFWSIVSTESWLQSRVN